MESGGLKKLKDADKLKTVNIEALDPPDKDGLLVKQGGSRKTWNKRWFVLKDGVLYYFKNKLKGAPLKGTIRLQANSLVEDAKGVKKKHAFQVTVMGRVFVIRATDDKSKQEWIEAIGKAIKNGGAKEGIPIPAPASPRAEKKADAGSTSGSSTPAATTDAPPNGDAAKDAPKESTTNETPKDEKKESATAGTAAPADAGTAAAGSTSTTTTTTSGQTSSDALRSSKESQATPATGEASKPDEAKGKDKEKDTTTPAAAKPEEAKKDVAKEDGNKKVLKNVFPRLLHLSGNGKNVNVLSVPVSADSLNLSDAFILDTENTLYQFNPPSAGLFEKHRAAELCREIDDFRGSDVQIVVITPTDEGADANRFWALLGGKKADIPKEAPGGGGQLGQPPHMYKVQQQQPDALAGSGGGGSGGTKFVFESMDKGYKINKNLLDTKSVMLFDLGFEIYVWVGLASRSFSEDTANAIALEYKTQFNRPDNVHVHRTLEGGESEVFELFLTA